MSPSDAGGGSGRSGDRDRTDEHVERWLPVLPDLDPDIEGAVTRMKMIAHHLRRFRDQSLADYDLQRHEFETLHALAGRGGKASPSELASDLDMAPASVTGRLDTLAHRGFVRRTPSATDRRRVDIELTEEGRATWLGSMDVLGHEEYRLLGALDAGERRTLSDLLRRILLAAEDVQSLR
ncbi:MarR family transcriptional regulator [Streptomyces sp. SID13666]|uniref:MarR family winged helix-turn-helix transcriptional regulator n=1 Tax=unclassified Streptomyces TaxID=2593676 RepID=UPI0013C14C44|nr:MULTISPECIES: MarR family transcriptional regulator [unclassified Streptomyces]NEA58920.1 MarR family transcriptional regulator [Streptomyces sp. SID13666]NEA72980.1 MarR family transcriptional regulator [Streptomyces sp. SID13588]